MKRVSLKNNSFAAFIALAIVFSISLFYLRNQRIGEAVAANHHSEKSEVSTQADWPQWRGVNRDGVSLERDLLKNWPVSGPKIAWRISVGDGFSGISVSNGKLYTLWDQKNGQYLFCFDAVTGKQLWQYRIDRSFMNQYGNGPRSSPAIDKNIVYAISSAGRLHAVNASTRDPVWTHDLQEEYGARIPSIGYSSSPLIDGNKLFVEVGGTDESAFIAFDKETGDAIWTSQTDLPAYSSPVAISVNGIRQIVFFSASGLFSLSPSDGKLFWKYSWAAECPATGIPLNAVTPLFIAPDKIFLSSGSATIEGGSVVQIKQENENFFVETFWTSKRMRNLFNSSVLYENHLYGFDGGILKCLDAATGEEKWKARGFQRGSLILADNHLIVLGERGKLSLVEANPLEFKETASAQILEGKCWVTPTLANGRLYLRNNKEMVCLDLK